MNYQYQTIDTRTALYMISDDKLADLNRCGMYRRPDEFTHWEQVRIDGQPTLYVVVLWDDTPAGEPLEIASYRVSTDLIMAHHSLWRDGEPYYGDQLPSSPELTWMQHMAVALTLRRMAVQSGNRGEIGRISPLNRLADWHTGKAKQLANDFIEQGARA